jgi:hypothetical protein
MDLTVRRRDPTGPPDDVEDMLASALIALPWDTAEHMDEQ